MSIHGPFNYLHYYLSKELLERIAGENAATTSFQLQESFFVEDLVVAQITRNLLSPIRHQRPLDLMVLDHAAQVLGAHILQTHSRATKASTRPRRGLESWQKLRTEEMLRDHLDGNVTIRDLAGASSLSPSHFGRCFRLSFGTSVHQRLIQLRIDCAKRLLLQTEQPLVENRVAIGILRPSCPQSHIQSS
jgi:AraC family transcriptional regulator